MQEQLHDGSVSHGVLEEEGLDGGGADHAEERNGQQQTTESCGLTGISGAHVVAQDALSLVLKHFYRVQVGDTGRFWKQSNCY